MKEIIIQSTKRNEMIDITQDLKQLLGKEEISEGVLIAYVPHTTAGITINEGADPSVQRDIIATLKKMVPEQGDYHHAEGNSDAHIKASLIGSSITVIIQSGKVMLGTWQHAFFYEGDGPRKRKIWVSFLSTA